MKHTTISLRRRHLMIAGLAGLAAPGALFGAWSGGLTDNAQATAGTGAEGKGLVISGRILGADGKPLAGATVDALNPGVDGIFSAVTDADGRFMFTTPAPTGRLRRIQYRVSHPEHGVIKRELYLGSTTGDAADNVAQLQRDEAGTWRASFGLTLA